MGFILFILFIFLSISLILTWYKEGRMGLWSKIFRTLVCVAAVAFFSYWFFEKSVVRFRENAISAQIINKLPQTLDFYIILVERKPEKNYKTTHIGSIRNDHYRLEYLKMKNSEEFWVAGYLGKNMVYFSQNMVPNTNIDPIVEANNYIIQSAKLAETAKVYVQEEHVQSVSLSIWASLDLLLLFLNTILLLRRNKK